jgi:hypothetical protein
LEAYNDVRRTVLIPITDLTGRPNRSVYPDSERIRNTSASTDIDRYSAFETVLGRASRQQYGEMYR